MPESFAVLLRPNHRLAKGIDFRGFGEEAKNTPSMKEYDSLQKTINIQRVLGIIFLNDRKRVEFDAVSFEAVNTAHHFVKAWCASPVHAIAVVQIARPVQR